MKGEGKLFSFELLDHSACEIKVAGFKEAVDKYYDIVQPGRMYM